MIFTLRFFSWLGCGIRLHFLNRLYLFIFIILILVILILFRMLLNSIIIIQIFFLLSEIEVQGIRIVLVQLNCDIIELIDICLCIKQKSKQRMINHLPLVDQCLFNIPNWLILFTVVAALHYQILILKIISLLLKLKSYTHMIGTVVQQLAAEIT